jgi:class 3 adenylate cyclase
MNIFDSYTQRLRSTLQQDKQLHENYSNFSGPETLVKAQLKSAATIGAIRRNMEPENSLLMLSHVVQGYDTSNAFVGKHPDFRHLLGTEKTEKHYITSVFIDIKGSTKMHDNYELETLYTITNTIQSAAIHVCLMFGGHIQRLQGDGVFVYFGGKSVDKATSVQQAITACSMFTYFVKNDLQQIFEEDGVENIRTRIGIDFGDDHEVLWGNFGVANCIELTTQSLHTSLAAKCQNHAGTNGIVVGQNVKDRLQLDEKYFDYVRNAKGEVTERYVYIGPKKGVYYTQYRFDWFNYLKSLPYIKSDREGNLYVSSLEEQEQDRLERLRNTVRVIQSGGAYTSTQGTISTQPTGIKNQVHRFHYE